MQEIPTVYDIGPFPDSAAESMTLAYEHIGRYPNKLENCECVIPPIALLESLTHNTALLLPLIMRFMFQDSH